MREHPVLVVISVTAGYAHARAAQGKNKPVILFHALPLGQQVRGLAVALDPTSLAGHGSYQTAVWLAADDFGFGLRDHVICYRSYS